MWSRPLLIVLVFALAAFSGCASSDPSADETDEAPGVVTRPDDQDYLQNKSLAEKPHVHDYWNGAPTLIVMDKTVQDGMTWDGPPRPVHVFRPEPAKVVPQGTSTVNITIDWKEGEVAIAGTPELWVKTAADRAAEKVKEIESGETVEIVSTNARNDLPHQVLSAWEFHFVLKKKDATTPIQWDGEITLLASAHRGLELPVFPPHPDQWNGTTERKVLSDEADAPLYQGDGGDGNCFGGCVPVHVMDDGMVVPLDAAYVEVVMTYSAETPVKLGLKYHGADTRELTTATLEKDEDNTRVYRIPVEGLAGDGVYATQSQWELVPVQETAARHWSGAYTIEATVHKEAE